MKKTTFIKTLVASTLFLAINSGASYAQKVEANLEKNMTCGNYTQNEENYEKIKNYIKIYNLPENNPKFKEQFYNICASPENKNLSIKDALKEAIFEAPLVEKEKQNTNY